MPRQHAAARPTVSQPPLPTDHVFVVQFQSQGRDHTGRYAGRIEHVVTGRATHFQSWAQLKAFIIQVLAIVADKPPSHPE